MAVAAVTAVTAVLAALGWLQEVLLIGHSPWMLLVTAKLKGSSPGLIYSPLIALKWLTALV
jgi:phosphohistidine phosphatase SixA